MGTDNSLACTLDQLFLTSPDLIFVQDRRGRFTYVNAAGAGAFGFERLYFLGKTWSDVNLPQAVRKTLMAQFEHTFATGQRSGGQVQIATAQTLRDYEYVLSAMLGLNGSVESVVFSGRDVTEQKRAESSLRESEEKYRSLFEAAIDLILIVDADTNRILDANSSALRQLGYAHAELLQRCLSQIEAPMEAEQRAMVLRHLETKGSCTFEHLYLRKDGSEMPVEISMQVIEYGQRLAVQSFARDISRRKRAEAEIHALNAQLEQRVEERTAELHRAYQELASEVAERRKAEIALQEQRAFLANVINTCAYPIAVKDWDGRFALVNQATAEHYGTTIEAMIGKTDADFNPNSEEAQRFIESNRQVMQSLQPRIIPEETVTSLSGQVRWYQTIIKPLLSSEADGAGQAQQVLVVGIDITARKQAEAQLEAANAEMQAVFAAMDALIVVCDRQGRQLKLLGGNQQLLYRPPEQPNQLLHDIFPKEIADAFISYIRQALDTQQPVRVEYSLPIGGKEIWSDASVSPIDQNLVVWTVRDITRRKQMESALQQSEARYRAIVEDQTELVCRFQADGTLSFANQAYSQMVGIPQADLVRHGYKMFLLVLDKAIAEQLMAPLTPDRPVCRAEYQVILPNGELRWQQWSNRAIFDPQGQLIEYQAVGSDCTDHKQMEAALRQSEERFRVIFEQAAVGMTLVDLSGRILKANQRFCDIVGYTESELLQLAVQQLTHPEDLAADRSYACQALTGERSSFTAEKRYIRKDGQWVWVNLTASLVRTPQGEPQSFIGVVEDASLRKQAEAREQEQDAHLRQCADAGTALLWITDREGLCIYFNRAWLDFTGRSLEQELGYGWTEAVHPNDLQHCLETFISAFSARQPFELEYRLRRSTGDYGWLLEAAKPVIEAEQGFLGYVGSCIDITEYRQAKPGLQREEKFRRIE